MMTELSREEVLRIAVTSRLIATENLAFTLDHACTVKYERFAAAIAKSVREKLQADGWRQCAKDQHTSQFCGQLEAAVAAERVVSDRLLEALKLWRIAADNAEECEFDDMAAFSIPMPLFCDADEATDSAIAEVEAMRKEKPEIDTHA